MDREKEKNGDQPPLQTMVVTETTPIRGHRGTRDLTRGTPKPLNRGYCQRGTKAMKDKYH